MKYAVVKVINGNYFIDSEGYTNLDAVEGYKEFISHGEN